MAWDFLTKDQNFLGLLSYIPERSSFLLPSTNSINNPVPDHLVPLHQMWAAKSPSLPVMGGALANQLCNVGTHPRSLVPESESLGGMVDSMMARKDVFHRVHDELTSSVEVGDRQPSSIRDVV